MSATRAKPRRPRHVGVLLAAGEGRRMGLGVPKALLELSRGTSFLAQLAATFERAGCDAVVVVTGFRAPLVERLHPELLAARNRRWREGQLCSVRVGLRAALRAGADVVALHPVDLPRVRVSSVRRLLTAAPRAPSGAVVAGLQGQPAHPVALSRTAVQELLGMRGIPHLRAALQRLGAERLELQDPGVLAEVDTPQDFVKVLGRQPRAIVNGR